MFAALTLTLCPKSKAKKTHRRIISNYTDDSFIYCTDHITTISLFKLQQINTLMKQITLNSHGNKRKGPDKKCQQEKQQAALKKIFYEARRLYFIVLWLRREKTTESTEFYFIYLLQSEMINVDLTLLRIIGWLRVFTFINILLHKLYDECPFCSLLQRKEVNFKHPPSIRLFCMIT